MGTLLARLLGDHGFVAVRDHPAVRGAVQRAFAAGNLTRLLPGIFSTPELAGRPDVRCAALQSQDPDAVFVGEIAGFLHGWNDPPDVVEAVVKHARPPATGFRFHRRSLAPELISVVSNLRVTSMAATVLDLASMQGSDRIDDGLRRGVPLARLWEAAELSRGRRGMREIRRMLADSRDEPWSAAERAAHRLLRSIRLEFTTNHRVTVVGQTYFLDIALSALQLAIEVDGHKFHSGRAAFEHDRRRDAELAAAGWQVVRVPAVMPLTEPQAFLDLIRRIIRRRARVLGMRSPLAA